MVRDNHPLKALYDRARQLQEELDNIQYEIEEKERYYSVSVDWYAFSLYAHEKDLTRGIDLRKVPFFAYTSDAPCETDSENSVYIHYVTADGDEYGLGLPCRFVKFGDELPKCDNYEVVLLNGKTHSMRIT